MPFGNHEATTEHKSRPARVVSPVHQARPTRLIGWACWDLLESGGDPLDTQKLDSLLKFKLILSAWCAWDDERFSSFSKQRENCTPLPTDQAAEHGFPKDALPPSPHPFPSKPL